MKRLFTVLVLLTVCLFPHLLSAQKSSEAKDVYDVNLGAMELRSIGPALTSGRIADFAVNPDDPAEFYVASASGGIWKTENDGVTFNPVFDNEGSYSIGCVTMDPNNHNVVWVGSGENNNQRSVSYGDGVYKSMDGGKSWKKVGLENSEHIGMIAVNQENSDIVYVAAYGPLWSAGGDRGLYKTTDGGKTWKAVLTISENTGVSEVHLDPRNPDVIYAVAHQRRRRTYTLIDGGPESAIYKSTDGGENWRKIDKGLPGGWLGRIGLAISPANPDVLYAIVEAAHDKGGFYRSTDRGESWEHRNNYSTSGNYYQELVPDPKNVDKVYAMDTYGHVTKDGGKTFERTGEKSKHVDNHALWIDPHNTDHLLNGNDGGVYESYDGGENWRFMTNLPVTQFYKVSVDNDEPFYNVYGGTQDNYSLAGPSRTTSRHGILSSDWMVTKSGDGFETVVDPTNPNIVYTQSQYGSLGRFDKQSGELTDIQPMARKGKNDYTWNWNAPLMISPHDHKTLYFAADKVFKSEDMGNSWQVISPDMTRQIDRNKLKVMGRVWPMDAVAKNISTSKYGNLVSLDESPVQQGLLYVGSDDGLIHVSEDDGAHWRTINKFPGVPEMTYVSDIVASHHDKNTVYASFDHHKAGDFKPYLLKSTDAGRHWKSIASDLPEKGTVYAIAEDDEDPNLLFVGTEYGLYVTLDGGEHWKELNKGLPTIAVRDLAIQQREDDLVLATFGRGFYILDNYAPLRQLTKNVANQDGFLFSVKDAKMFLPYSKLGGLGSKEKGFQGQDFFTAKNPPVGARITYYLKNSILTKEEKRQKEETEKFKKDEPVYYPSYKEYRAEQEEKKPYLFFTIKDSDGNVVRRIRQAAAEGMHRLTWDFRYPNMTRVNPSKADEKDNPGSGILAMPGTYQVTMSKSVNGELTPLAGPVSFNARMLNNRSIPDRNQQERVAFQENVSKLTRAVNGAQKTIGDIDSRIKYYRSALKTMNASNSDISTQIDSLENKLERIKIAMNGDPYKSDLDMDQHPSINDRVRNIAYAFYRSSGNPTDSQRKQYQIAADEFGPLLNRLKQLVNTDLKQLDQAMDRINAPWTPGRFPEWNNQ